MRYTRSMRTETADAVLERALSLPERDRAEIAARLLESRDQGDSEGSGAPAVSYADVPLAVVVIVGTLIQSSLLHSSR